MEHIHSYAQGSQFEPWATAREYLLGGSFITGRMVLWSFSSPQSFSFSVTLLSRGKKKKIASGSYCSGTVPPVRTILTQKLINE